MATALIALGIVAPWLVWFSFVSAPATTLLLGVVALVCALHGWGRLVARLSESDDVDSALVIQWGIAAVICLGGMMIMLHVYSARLLLVTGTVLHSADLATRIGSVREHVASLLVPKRRPFWMVPLLPAIVLAGIQIFAAAGQDVERPFDDESHVIAQVERLSTTGTLADPIGAPRQTQLGGETALAALPAVFGPPGLARVADSGLGFLLFLLLVCSTIRPRDAVGAIWATAVVLALASLRPGNADLLPVWTAAGLILALHRSYDPPIASPVTAGLVAGALCALRLEIAPFALAMIATRWWNHREQGSLDGRRLAALLAPVAAVVAFYWLARAMAWSTVAPAAKAMLAGKQLSLLARLAVFGAIAAASIPVLVFATREASARVMRPLAIAAGLGIAGIASRLGGTTPSSSLFIWPIAMVLAVAVVSSLSTMRAVERLAMVLGAACCLLVFDASVTAHRPWSWRLSSAMADIEYLRHEPSIPSPYADIVARVPAGARLAVWVRRPELLDYARNAIIDLRTPRVARSGKLDKIAAAVDARWLLVELDGDEKASHLIETGRTLASRGPLYLVELH